MAKIYVDMDGVLCDYDTAYREQFHSTNNPFPQSRLGFFKELEPMPYAQTAMALLKRKGHDVFILTRPSIKNNHCWSEKAYWIEKNLGYEWLEKLIITCRKGLLCDGKAWLIDDVLHSDAGQQNFDEESKLIWFNERMDWKKIVFQFGAD